MTINYKNIALRTLNEFVEKNPNMTLGEILYSVLRENNSGLSDIKAVQKAKDEDLYSIIEKAKQYEEE